jgi:hypothetical protein
MKVPLVAGVLALLLSSFFVCSLTSHSAGAAPVVGFQPGNIIDDSVFTNSSSMSPEAIQAFINTQGENCTDGEAPCLKNFQEGGRSSTWIIYDAAKEFNINPQVLLVLLQKEVGLVTRNKPEAGRYRTATGYGCPDGADCNAQYFGFTNQVRWAARMYRAIMDNSPNWYTPYVLGNNFIKWNPENSCSGTTVNIQNRATQALYNYTPYQPNQAALNAGYGNGDGCSSYGNRNFYLYFTDWFGSVRGLMFDALAYRQSPYPTMKAGESKQIYIDYKNMGSWEWRDDTSTWSGLPPVHLAATSPINRASIFSYGWPSAGRSNLTFSKVYKSDGTTLADDQHVVKPGQIARYQFNVTAPWSAVPGVYRENFQPVLEGADGWNMKGVSWIDITIEPTYRSDFVSQCSMPTVAQNSTVDCFIRYKNTGNIDWYDDTSVPNGQKPIHLAASGPINRSSNFSSSWPSSGRAGVVFSKVLEQDNTTLATNQHRVQLGQIAEFHFKLTARNDITTGTYREYFQPVAEDAAGWAMGGVAWIDVTVSGNTRKAAFVTQSAYPTISRGSSAPVFFSFKNVSNISWYDSTSAPAGVSPIHIAATNPINRSSAFSYGWQSAGRPTPNFSKVYESDGVTLSADQHTVNPSQIARFDFNLTPPWTLNPGVHREYFQLVSENSSNWMFTGSNGWMDTTVTP